MKIITAMLLGGALLGCDISLYARDQELRQKLFFECMKSLPKGHDATMYNDLAEVVNACGDQAYYLSNVCVKNCK